MTVTRRDFLTATAASAAGAAALALARPAAAIEPIQRPGKARLRSSIAAYSYRQLLEIRKKPKPDMTLLDFLDTAADLGLDAAELTQYYFPETSPGFLAKLKGHATRRGLDISGTAVGNNFCVRDPAKLKAQISSVKEWVEHTSRLGGKTIRIFAGNVEKGDSEKDALARCVEAIQEACDHAGKYGIFLALENHGGITATPAQMLPIVKAVQHPWFGVNLDGGNFHGPDPYAELAEIAPYAVVAQLKTEIRRQGAKKAETADLKRLTDMLRGLNYQGYVVLEYEAAEDLKTAIPRHVAELKKLMG